MKKGINEKEKKRQNTVQTGMMWGYIRPKVVAVLGVLQFRI